MALPRTPCSGVLDARCVSRFREHVAPANDRGCCIWTGTVNVRTGRPQFEGGPERFDSLGRRKGRKLIFAHRFAYELVNGEGSAGSVLRHSCDVPLCCAVEHLIPGTQAENVADREARFVNSSGGEGHGISKLTHEDAREIYRLMWEGIVPPKDIAARYGVSRTHLSGIKHGRYRQFATKELP